MTESSQLTPSRSRAAFLVVLAGVAVALSLREFGVYVGQPRSLPTWGFTSMQSFKAWVSTGVLSLVAVQLVTALWLFGRLPGAGAAPPWVRTVHRASGLVAFLASLPVAWYCLYAFGFDTSTPRTTAHSIFGCAFYGAFAAKMLTLRLRGVPSFFLPLLGGVVFTSFVAAWSLSALWWFRLIGFGI